MSGRGGGSGGRAAAGRAAASAFTSSIAQAIVARRAEDPAAAKATLELEKDCRDKPLHHQLPDFDLALWDRNFKERAAAYGVTSDTDLVRAARSLMSDSTRKLVDTVCAANMRSQEIDPQKCTYVQLISSLQAAMHPTEDPKVAAVRAYSDLQQGSTPLPEFYMRFQDTAAMLAATQNAPLDQQRLAMDYTAKLGPACGVRCWMKAWET